MSGASPVEIIPFEAQYRSDFERLNVEWLEKYFAVEPLDVVVLSQPQAIIDGGGAVFLARLDGDVVGTCALLKKGDRFELSKMSVTEGRQGLGIGRALAVAAIAAFETSGARELYLETNRVLGPAIALYRSLGFIDGDPADAPAAYARADVYMVYRRPSASDA